MRAHNLIYSLGGALSVPVVPTASRYAATGDAERLRQLTLRGTRYTLALFVPLCVTLMALAEPILDVWLGDRYAGGAAALTILVSYWLLYGGLVVTPGFLVGAGAARYAARIYILVAALNLVLALALTPSLELEGPALATAIPFLLAFPLLLGVGLRAGGGVRLGELARTAWLPAYALGAALAAALVGLRLAARAGDAGGGAGRREPAACSPTGSPSTSWCWGRGSGGWCAGSGRAAPTRDDRSPPLTTHGSVGGLAASAGQFGKLGDLHSRLRVTEGTQVAWRVRQPALDRRT